MLAIVALLGRRLDEPPSRAKAITLLEKVRQTDGLTPQQMVALAQLYDRDGKWEQAQNLMLEAVSNTGGTAELLIVFAEMLLDHDAAEEAARYVDRAEQRWPKAPRRPMPPIEPAIRVMRARLLVRAGKNEEAAKILESVLPRPLPQNQLVRLVAVANQMEELKLFDAAEATFQEYASLSPKDGTLAMAGYYGRRGQMEKAFEMLETARKSQPMIAVLPVALTSLRSFPDQITPERLKTLEQWIREAMAQTKEPARLQLLQAELYDLSGRYDEVADAYRAVLKQPDLPPLTVAIVKNNLAFILAAINPTPQRGAERRS